MPHTAKPNKTTQLSLALLTITSVREAQNAAFTRLAVGEGRACAMAGLGLPSFTKYDRTCLVQYVLIRHTMYIHH